MLSRSQNEITIAGLQSTMDVILFSLSDTSKRQYAHTYKLWNSFCTKQGYSASHITPQHVIEFLNEGDLSHRTKQNRLSHLRKLIEAIHVENPQDGNAERLYGQLKLLKVKSSEADKQSRRNKTALAPAQVYEAFKVFDCDTKVHIRNRALLAILLYCGLRRAELTALQWTDIDLENNQLTVHAGKGDKQRTIPILGGIDYIKAWKAQSAERVYVFCGMAKGDKLNTDKPMSEQAVYKVVKLVQKELQLDTLAPHDFRRTIITRLLSNGASLADVQFLAGHADPQTTLRYAQIKDAKEVAGRLSQTLPY